MPTTSYGLFQNAVQSTTSPVEVDWVDLANILVDDANTTVYTTDSSPDPQITETITLDDPVSGAEVPPGQIITDIAILFNTRRDAAAQNTMRLLDITIAGGTPQGEVISGGPLHDEIVSGDLAFWGITEQQAYDFFNGLEDLTFYGQKIGGAGGVRLEIAYAQLQVTYESAQVNLPSIF